MLFIIYTCFSADDDCEKLVSVLLDGEETMIDFVDVAFEDVSSVFSRLY